MRNRYLLMVMSYVVGLGLVACGDTVTQVYLGGDAGPQDGITVIYADGGAEEDRKPATQQDSGKDSGSPVDAGPTAECQDGWIRCQDNYTEECSGGKWVSTNKVAGQAVTQCVSRCTNEPGVFKANHDGAFPVVEVEVQDGNRTHHLQIAREINRGTYEQMANYCRVNFNMVIVSPLYLRGDGKQQGPMGATCDPLVDNAAIWPRGGVWEAFPQFHISRDDTRLYPRETYCARGYEQGTTPDPVTIQVDAGASYIERYAVCGRWID